MKYETPVLHPVPVASQAHVREASGGAYVEMSRDCELLRWSSKDGSQFEVHHFRAVFIEREVPNSLSEFQLWFLLEYYELGNYKLNKTNARGLTFNSFMV